MAAPSSVSDPQTERCPALSDGQNGVGRHIFDVVVNEIVASINGRPVIQCRYCGTTTLA